MILDSIPWKDGLLRDATALRDWAGKRRSAKRSFAIEETVFVGAFKIRRLIESEKISSTLASSSVSADFYPCKKKGINQHTKYDIEDHYDFSAAVDVRISIKDMANTIIHSFVFAETVEFARKRSRRENPSRVTGFIFNSDRSRDKGLWYVSLDEYIAVLNAIGNDNPNSKVSIFNPTTGQWDSWLGNGNPPADFAAKVSARVQSP
ncbi:hypothetical protein MPLB_2110021 [Mesorhizobium sp. ORS 3324]|nr:hypothetical protein MPLB_2110021 [Mesorhizobium sp. ORS 3324]